jgi:hypothetical protein
VLVIGFNFTVFKSCVSPQTFVLPSDLREHAGKVMRKGMCVWLAAVYRPDFISMQLNDQREGACVASLADLSLIFLSS